MAERQTDTDPQERHETVDPRNPPSSVVEPSLIDAPKSALGVVGMWYYLGPLLLIVIVIVAGVYFWADDPEVDPDKAPAVGTIGQAGDDSTPGGGDPDRRRGSTGNEVEFRGGGDPSQGPMPGLTAAPVTRLGAIADGDLREMVGRRIDVQDVAVVDMRNPSMFQVQEDTAKITVIAPPDAPPVRGGMRVDVSGTLEPDGAGGVRIRATRVNTR